MAATIHQLHPEPADRAREGLDKYQRGGKIAREGVIEYGEALQEHRNRIAGDTGFGQWVHDNGLDAVKPFDDQRERWAAIGIAKAAHGKIPWAEIVDDCPNSRPTNIWKWLTARHPELKQVRKQSTIQGGKPARPRIDKARAAAETIAARGEKPDRGNVTEESGVGSHAAQIAVLEIRAAEAARAELLAKLGAKINADGDLSLTAQQKITARVAIERKNLEKELAAYKAQLDNEVDERITSGVKAWVAEHLKPLEERARIQEEYYKELNAKHIAILPRPQYTLILKALAPDRRNAVTEAELTEAFRIFTGAKLRLVGIDQ